MRMKYFILCNSTEELDAAYANLMSMDRPEDVKYEITNEYNLIRSVADIIFQKGELY